MTTVGLIGLGIMGSAMSGHLLQRGVQVVGYDVSPHRTREFTAAGGTAAASAEDVAASVEDVAGRAGIVVTSLPSADSAVDVCTALAASGSGRLVVVETSTLPHSTKQRCRELLAGAGAELLDCPLSGTGAQALDRDVVVYGSGDEPAFESARPVMEAFSRSVRYLGPFGRGSTMKYVANLLVAVHNAATAEAFALGQRAGLEPQQIYDTIRDGAGNSVIFEKRGRLMMDNQFLPATATMSMFIKDTELIAGYAETLGLPTPMLDTSRELYRQAVAQGLGDSDAAALLLGYEQHDDADGQ